MRLTKVRLENWRNFRQVEVLLQDRAFIVGPNASGKSNFLDAFKFLRDVASRTGGGLQDAVLRRGGVTRVRCLAARKKTDVTLAVDIGDDDVPDLWSYELSFNRDSKGRVLFLLLPSR